MTRKDELYNKILRLYDEGVSALDIVKQTGLGSTATLYRILNRIGAKGRNTTDGFRVVVTLPNDLKGFVDGIEDFSKWVAKVAYRNIEGVNPTPVIENSGGKFAYKNFEGGSVNIENRDATPAETKPDYKNFEGRSATLLGEDEAAFADLTIIFYNNCATIHTTTLHTFMDEDIVKSLVLGYCKSNEVVNGTDEIAAYNGKALIWLWHPIYNGSEIAGLEI